MVAPPADERPAVVRFACACELRAFLLTTLDTQLENPPPLILHSIMTQAAELSANDP